MPTVPLSPLFLQARYVLVRDVTGASYTAHKPYCEALNKAGIPTLSERRESLSIKLFEDIVSNEHHKLANLLPQMSSSYARRLRNKRRFNTPVCRTDRFMNSFIISHAM